MLPLLLFSAEFYGNVTLSVLPLSTRRGSHSNKFGQQNRTVAAACARCGLQQARHAATSLDFVGIYGSVTPSVLPPSTRRGSHSNKLGQQNRTVAAACARGGLEQAREAATPPACPGSCTRLLNARPACIELCAALRLVRYGCPSEQPNLAPPGKACGRPRNGSYAAAEYCKRVRLWPVSRRGRRAAGGALPCGQTRGSGIRGLGVDGLHSTTAFHVRLLTT